MACKISEQGATVIVALLLAPLKPATAISNVRGVGEPVGK
jgi:hypothetical protein